jgi:hypothetical protein
METVRSSNELHLRSLRVEGEEGTGANSSSGEEEEERGGGGVVANRGCVFAKILLLEA